MTLRKLIAYFIIIAVCVGVALFAVEKFAELEGTVARTVRARLAVEFGDQLQVEKIRLRWGNVHLHHVSYQRPDSLYTLFVDDISIGYSLRSLIESGFQIEKISDEIIVNRPKLTVDIVENGKPYDEAEASQQPLPLPPSRPSSLSFEDEYQIDIAWARLIKKLVVSGGEVAIRERHRNRTTKVFRDLSGGIRTAPHARSIVKLAGKLFASKRHNVLLSGAIDLQRNAVDTLAIALREYQIGSSLPFFNPPYVEIDSGVVKGHFALTRDPKTGRLVFHGSGTLDRGGMRIKNSGLKVEAASITVHVRKKDIAVQEGAFLLNGSPLRVTGTMQNFFDPRLNLVFYSEQFDVTAFIKKLNAASGLPLAGTGKIKISVQDSLQNPSFRGAFYAESLRLAARQFQNVGVRMRFHNARLELEQVQAASGGARLEGSGAIDFQTERKLTDLAIVASGDFAESLPLLQEANIERANGTIAARVQGPLASPATTGYFDLQFSRANRPGLKMLGHFNIHNWNLHFQAGGPDTTTTISGDIADLIDRPRYSIRVKNLAKIASSLDMPVAQALASRYRLAGQFTGETELAQLTLSAVSRSRALPDWSARFQLDKDADNLRRISGVMALNPDAKDPITTQFAAVVDDSSLVFTSLGNEHWLTGNLSISLRRNKQIAGIIKLSGFELDRFKPGAQASHGEYGGRLFAEVQVAGTVSDPRLEVRSWLLDGVYRGIGIFSGELAASIDSRGFALHKFDVQHQGSPFLRATGRVDFSPRNVDLEVIGNSLDADMIIYAITGYRGVLTGTADLHARLLGAKWPLALDGDLRIHDGNVMWFKFDQLNFDFGTPDQPENASQIGDFGIRAGSIAYVKEGQFVLNGEGLFPFSKKDSVHIKLEGAGNFLALLPDFAEVFRGTRSTGKLDLTLRGPYKGLRLYDSHATILDGELELSRVTKKISDLKGEAYADGDFIHIKSLTGRIGDAIISVTNRPGVPEGAGPLKTPLRIGRTWMSLGTLHVTSSANGLPANIPAFMEEGEIGRFWIRGRDGEPAFFIAGPWQHPVFRGEIVMHNANVTFPFDEGDEEIDPIIKNILLNANWDVLAIAGKDNRYVKKIPSGLDRVYVNIGIDGDVSRLSFSGIVRDTSRAAAAPPGSPVVSAVNGAASTETNADRPDAAAATGDVEFRVSTRARRADAGPDTSTFRIEGVIESTQGTIEYLDLNFRVDRFGAVWDRSELQPIVYGRAWTTVTDSLNFPHDVFLKIYARDPESGEEQERGRWEHSYFRLESDHLVFNNSQADILAALGYSLENVKEKATDMIGISTDNLLFRPLLRPVERTLERSLGLDMVRVNSRFTRNFLEMNLSPDYETTKALLRSTRLTVGKYLSERMFLLYTGQVESSYEYSDLALGLRHTLGLEYRFNPGLLLQMEYDYNSVLQTQKDDKKIWLRHSFPLKSLTK